MNKKKFFQSNLNLVSIIVLLFMSLFTSGCWFLAGAAAGAAATGAAYEHENKEQLDKLEADYEAGKIDRETYESQKRELEEGSVVY